MYHHADRDGIPSTDHPIRIGLPAQDIQDFIVFRSRETVLGNNFWDHSAHLLTLLSLGRRGGK